MIHHKDIISSQEGYQNMKWFGAGTKKMSGLSFGDFIKLTKPPCTSTWVSQQRRLCGHQ